jgi:hypothetical protein
VRIAVPDGWQATTPTDRWGYLITELGTVYFGLNFGLATGEAEEIAPEEVVGEEAAEEEVPFILPITGHVAPAGYLWPIAVGVALAAAGLAAIRALRGQGPS